MVLAAGLGTRMRPLTATCPSRSCACAGAPLIDHVLDRISARRHRARRRQRALPARAARGAPRARRTAPEIVISDERGAAARYRRRRRAGAAAARWRAVPDSQLRLGVDRGRRAPISSVCSRAWDGATMDSLHAAAPRPRPASATRGEATSSWRADGLLQRRERAAHGAVRVHRRLDRPPAHVRGRAGRAGSRSTACGTSAIEQGPALRRASRRPVDARRHAGGAWTRRRGGSRVRTSLDERRDRTAAGHDSQQSASRSSPCRRGSRSSSASPRRSCRRPARTGGPPARPARASRRHAAAADAPRRARACRKRSCGPPAAARMLLPRIRPIAEGEEDLGLLSGSPASDALGSAAVDIPAAVGELERRLVLTELILALVGRDARVGRARRRRARDLAGAGGSTPAQAAHLAAELVAADGHGRDRERRASPASRDARARSSPSTGRRRSSSSRSSPRPGRPTSPSAACCRRRTRRNRAILAEAERLRASPPRARSSSPASPARSRPPSS